MITLKNYTVLTLEEHHDLLAIRNLESIRQVSTSTDIIDFEHHLQWVKSLTPQKNYYAIFDEHTLCGGIHLVLDNENPTWGVFFDPKTSPWIISSVTFFFIEHCFNHLGLTMLNSLIRMDNTSAITFNRQLGFKPFDESDDFTLMQLDKESWSAQKEKKILKNILQYATHYPIHLESL